MKMKDLNHLKNLAEKYTSIYDVCKVIRHESLYGDNKSLSIKLINDTIPKIKDSIIVFYINKYNIKEEVVADIRSAITFIQIDSIVKDIAIASDLKSLIHISKALKEDTYVDTL